MITETAKYRIRVIAHWQKYGLSSTIDTFGVKRRTLFNWKHLLKEDRWKYEALNLGDRTPKTKRKRLWSLDTIERFVHGMRRYVITFEDIYTRYAFAWSTTSHA